MKTKNTPTPWLNKSGVILTNDEKDIIVSIADSTLSLELDEANAELIVRAVNCHDELVKACEFALMQTDERRMPVQYKKLSDALKRARGES